MKHLAFVLCCLMLASCATSYQAGMLEATSTLPVENLPPLHTDPSPTVHLSHDALLMNGKQSSRAKEKVEILLKNELKTLTETQGANGSIEPEVSLDFQYKGYGWTTASAMTFMALNLVGMPFISWEVDAHMRLKVRDNSGKVVWEENYFSARKHNMGIYYNYASSEHLYGTSLELIREMLVKARTDLQLQHADIAAVLTPVERTLISSSTEVPSSPASLKESPTSGEFLFNQNPLSQTATTIAVIPKTGTDCNGQARSSEDLAIYAETALLGTYAVVDRQFIEDTLQEIKLGMTGITFEDNVLQAGCIANADGYLFVEYGCMQNRESIKAKLVHCESSQIVWNCFSVDTTPRATFEQVVNELAP